MELWIPPAALQTRSGRWSLDTGRERGRLYSTPERPCCQYCGSSSRDGDCEPVTCLACGSTQCALFATASGTCALCVVGIIPGYGHDKPCGYKGCASRSVATAPRVYRVCRQHMRTATRRAHGMGGRDVTIAEYCAHMLTERTLTPGGSGERLDDWCGWTFIPDEVDAPQAPDVADVVALWQTPAPAPVGQHAACAETDAVVAAWNTAVATGDQAAIADARSRTLRWLASQAMNDDPRAVMAGWTPV